MSLMDSVFDVRHALKGKPEAELFREIEAKLWQWENERNVLLDELDRLKTALGVVGKCMMQEAKNSS